jgi:hypothetical protein
VRVCDPERYGIRLMLVENDIGADERGRLIEQAGGLYGGANLL